MEHQLKIIITNQNYTKRGKEYKNTTKTQNILN